MDEDGSQKIEFEEFVSIVRGGKFVKNVVDDNEDQGTAAIYSFFKRLTSDKKKKRMMKEM